MENKQLEGTTTEAEKMARTNKEKRIRSTIELIDRYKSERGENVDYYENNRPVTVSELLQEAEKDLKRILEGEGEVYLPLPEGWAEGMGDMQNDGYAFPATMPLSKAKKLAKEMVKQLREKGFLED